MVMDDEAGVSSQWSREQDKAFENAIAAYLDDDSDRWEKIAAGVEGKTPEEIEQHYEVLLDDISQIESGFVPLPSYNNLGGSMSNSGEEGNSAKKRSHLGDLNIENSYGGKGSRLDQERRKGIAWTEDEHRLFLLGLDKYGKGDWRSISRNFVLTRTPTQVASHAQKYFVRLNSLNNKERRRSSIHDITNVGDPDISAPGPITGQSDGTHTIVKPNAGPIVPADGAPMNLQAHMSYGVRVPDTGAPINVGLIPYPHTSSSHR